MNALNTTSVYVQYALLVGAEIVSGLAGRWRIGRHIASALANGEVEAGKLYATIEKQYGKGWGKRTLYASKNVYDAFPSMVSVEGKDCPIWAIPGNNEYSGDYGVYSLLAQSTNLKTEAQRLIWAKFASGRELSEVKATLKFATEKNTLDAPASSHTARCEAEAFDKANRLAEAQRKEEQERLVEMARIEGLEISRKALSAEAAEVEAWEVYEQNKYTPMSAILGIAKLTQFPTTDEMGTPSALQNLVAHVGNMVAHSESVSQGNAENVRQLAKVASEHISLAGEIQRLQAITLALFASAGKDASRWSLEDMEKFAFADKVAPGATTGKAFNKVA